MLTNDSKIFNKLSYFYSINNVNVKLKPYNHVVKLIINNLIFAELNKVFIYFLDIECSFKNKEFIKQLKYDVIYHKKIK
jgi:hypothetical protein